MYKLVNGVELPLTEEELSEAAEREAVHEEQLRQDAKVAYKRLRQAEYPSLEDLTVALMEKEEGRPEALDELKAKRAAIKAKYPKPV